MGQQTRIENPEINPYIYGQLIFGKVSGLFKWERQSFPQVVPGQLDIHMQKKEVAPLHLIPHARINSKWIKDLHENYKA